MSADHYEVYTLAAAEDKPQIPSKLPTKNSLDSFALMLCRGAVFDFETSSSDCLVSELGQLRSAVKQENLRKLRLHCLFRHLGRMMGDYSDDAEDIDPPLSPFARRLRDLLNKDHKPVSASEHSAFWTAHRLPLSSQYRQAFFPAQELSLRCLSWPATTFVLRFARNN